MADVQLKLIDKVKVFVGKNAIMFVVIALFAGYCLYRMKKRNVKLFGR